MNPRDEAGYALGGVGVLDLAGERGAFGSRLLADLGARVIKVEKPGGCPPAGRSFAFLFENANKLGITLDLDKREGREIFLQLLRRNDVLLEDFPPGCMGSLGLGPEVLREANPSIVIVSVTGFGQDGPRKGYRTSDRIASAFGGQMFLCGGPEYPPVKPFGNQSYYTASLFAAISALVGLRERRRDRGNLSFDVSAQEAVAASLDHVLVRYFHEGRVAGREGGLQRDRGFCISPCRDGFILLTLFQQWPTLVEWMASEGMAEDLTDGKWGEEEYRRQHLGHVVGVIGRWTRTHAAQELFEKGQALRFPWAPVRSPGDLLRCPQLAARDFFVEVADPEGGQAMKYPGLPCKFGMPVPGEWIPAPGPGEHNRRIYHEELGMPLPEMERLHSLGVI